MNNLCAFLLKIYYIHLKKFQKADINGDGVLSVDEYYRILKEHGIQCSRDEILQIIQIADKDHDG